MGVNNGAESEGLGFAAGGLELRVGHRLRAAFADAFGGEEFDKVGALLLSFADELAKFFRRTGLFGERLERGKHARSGKDAAGNGVAEIFVFRGTGTLDGGEAGVESEHGIFSGVQDGLCGRLVFPSEATVVEMPVDVRVGVDPPGSDGEAGEIVGDGA